MHAAVEQSTTVTARSNHMVLSSKYLHESSLPANVGNNTLLSINLQIRTFLTFYTLNPFPVYVAGTCSASGALFVIALAALVTTVILLKCKRRSTPNEPDNGMITMCSSNSTNVQSTMSKLVLAKQY